MTGARARVIPKPANAPTKDDHKQQKKREKRALESKYLLYGCIFVAAMIAVLAHYSSPPPRVGVCGDGLCGFDETGGECPADCKGSCGDGFCSMSETCSGATQKRHQVEECPADCGECDASATLAGARCSAEATGLTAAHNNSLLWGTYRPHLFNGIRTRSAAPVLVGVMWHSPAALNPLRYEATSSGIKSYGWLRHDARSFGLQQVVDTEVGVEVNSSFVKSAVAFDAAAAVAGGGDWGLKLKVRRVKREHNRPKTKALSVVLHISSLGTKAAFSEPTLNRKHANSELPIATFSGTNADTGRFAVSVFARGAKKEKEKEKEKAKGVDVRYFGGEHMREEIDAADDLLKNVYAYAQQKKGEAGELSLPNQMLHKTANTIFIQVTIPVNGDVSEVDIVLNSFPPNTKGGAEEGVGAEEVLGAAQALAGERHDRLLHQRLAAFDERFDQTFKLADKKCVDDKKATREGTASCLDGRYSPLATEVAKVALSQVLGGMAYLDGTWFMAPAPYYNTSVEQPAVVSFSATPCRDGFARGFLWDEGFHQLLVARWDAAISRDVLLHWFNLMRPDGWIPREQFIGGETRRRIESRWWTQNPEHANPPTLLLALKVLMDGSDGEGAGESFLGCLAPKIKVWLEWFKRTQRAPALHSFKWSGRKRTHGIWHTLSSGLDDYPRANWTSDLGDRHVDLFSWMVVMHRVLYQIHEKLNMEHRALGSTIDVLSRHVEAVHWDETTTAFADRGYMQYAGSSAPRVDFVQHYGYLSLFPVLLNVVPASFSTDKLLALLRLLQSQRFLLSKAGVRSLSPTSPQGTPDTVYGTQEDYWRGKVWININYLALAALFRVSGAEDVALSETAQPVYAQVRTNVVHTIVTQYAAKGFLFEQYDDKTRSGLKHKPFAGWTALVLLIMAELY